MKKIIVVLLLVAAFTLNYSNSSESAETIKIGMVTPLTGIVATYGQSHLKGMTLALEEINAKNGDAGPIFEIISYDDSSNPQQAATGAQRFADRRDIMLITGSCTSPCTLAMVPITTRARISHIGVASSSTSLSGISPYYNRMASLDFVTGINMVDAVVDKLNGKNVVILFANTDSGKALQKTCEARAIERGLTILDQISYLDTDQDYSAIVTRVKDLNPDAIVMCGYYTDSALFIRQARQANLNTNAVGSVSVYSPKYIEIAGDAAEGTIVMAAFIANSPDERIQEFVKRYHEKYDIEPDSYAALAYDCMYVIEDAVKRAKESNNGTLTREFLNTAIRSTNYNGVTGNVNFNDDGNWIRPFLYAVVKNGKFEVYK